MGKPNWTNKTVFVGDNLHVMRGMNSESVDLIYLDPPFNSNKNYAAPVGSKAAEAAFKDTWTLDDVDVIEHDVFRDRERGLYSVIATARETHSKGMFSYLLMMAVRLLEMRRILKPTGSLYLHCDPTASHYLKLLMDAVFGRTKFRNEIIWSYKRYTAKSNRFQREHDVLLFYRPSGEGVFNAVYEPYGTGSGKRDSHYRQDDDSRWYRWQKRKGKEPYKIYLSDDGRRAGDVWTISHINASARERVGYPTQKPLQLLDRIIQASSNEGDMVLDPFCGCATTMVSADSLGRDWVGCDLSQKAVDLVVDRIKEAKGLWSDIVARETMPRRTDKGDELSASGKRNSKETLYGKQGGGCQGCGMHFHPNMLEMAHIIPKAKGGTDHADNFQLLCSNCNRRKGSRSHADLMAELSKKPSDGTDLTRGC